MSKPWTMSEIKVMRLFASLGSKGVAQLLDRSVSSVSKQAQDHAISLEASKDDINIDDEVLNLLHRVVESQRLSICPMCGRRWATMKDTGICRPCHLDRLIALHQEQIDVEVRQRALTAARKEKQRRLGELDD
jgi:hypothetical protein